MGLPACYCAALLRAGLGRAGSKRPAALLPGKKRKTIDPCSTSCTPSSLARESARASRALAGAAARRAEALGDSGDGAAAAYRGRGGGSGDGDVANVLASSRARTEGTGRGCRLSCAASARRARGRGGGHGVRPHPGSRRWRSRDLLRVARPYALLGPWPWRRSGGGRRRLWSGPGTAVRLELEPGGYTAPSGAVSYGWEVVVLLEPEL